MVAIIKTTGLFLLLTTSALAAHAESKLPEKTHDGLTLLEDTKAAAVYQLPGADLSQYSNIALLDAYVAFKKNYKRDYNRDAPFEERLNDSDLAKIRKDVAAEFRKVFEKVLVDKGRHTLVEDQTTPGTLVIRPAIIDLVVTAPDKMTAGRVDNYVASTGSMTLYMELYDGPSGQIIYRVVDPEAAPERGDFRWANAVTNRSDADLILRRWAELLNSHLQTVKNLK